MLLQKKKIKKIKNWHLMPAKLGLATPASSNLQPVRSISGALRICHPIMTMEKPAPGPPPAYERGWRGTPASQGAGRHTGLACIPAHTPPPPAGASSPGLSRRTRAEEKRRRSKEERRWRHEEKQKQMGKGRWGPGHEGRNGWKFLAQVSLKEKMKTMGYSWGICLV